MKQQSFKRWLAWPGANGSYTVYSIAVAVVWAIILAAVLPVASIHTRTYFLVAFLGYATGWTSATLARPYSGRPSPAR